MKLGTALRNDVAGTLGHLFDGGLLRIHAGSAPSNPDTTPSGTLLCTFRLPVIAFLAPASGTVAIAGKWFGTAATSGTAGCFQLSSADGTRKAGGSITATGGGGDITLATTAVTAGGVVQLTGFTLTLPQGS